MSGDELLVLARSRGTGASEWQWRTVPNGATNLPSSYMPAGVPFHVACVPGKGFGLVASRRLQAGMRLLAEAPLAYCNRVDEAEDANVLIRAAVGALDGPSRASYDALSQHGGPATKTVEGIWHSNALPAGGEGRMAAATYALISRTNHSCRPNAHTAWNEKTGRQTLHAAQPIAEGDEILISYLEPGLTRDERRAQLRARFGFKCACALCSLEGAALARSDARQRRISEIDAITDDGGDGTTAHPRMAELVREKLELLVAEELPREWGHMDMACAFARCVVDGDVGQAKVWIRDAATSARVLLGSDSPTVLGLEAYVRR